MIQYYNNGSKIKLTESINNLLEYDNGIEGGETLSSDDSFVSSDLKDIERNLKYKNMSDDEWLKQRRKDLESDLGETRFEGIMGIEAKPLDWNRIAGSNAKKDPHFTYTYVQDSKTAIKVLEYFRDFFSKREGWKIGHASVHQDINEIAKEVVDGSSEELPESSGIKGKFLQTGTFETSYTSTTWKETARVKVYVNSVKLDIPEFTKNYAFAKSDSKFIIYLDTNVYNLKHIDDKEGKGYDMFNSWISELVTTLEGVYNDNDSPNVKGILDSNWALISPYVRRKEQLHYVSDEDYEELQQHKKDKEEKENQNK